MKKYSLYLLPAAALTILGSLAISGAILLVTVMTASDVVGDLPIRYMEHLYLPFLFVALPVVGMLLFGLVLLGTSKFGQKKQASVMQINAAPESQVHNQLKAA